ncbi:MAG: SIR2 family protein, partial [Acidimicrobiales bacterium]
MTIAPEDSLSSSIHAAPGTYALLIGSGVSLAAGIATSWDIVSDLTRRLAALLNEDPGPDTLDWYLRRFGIEPNYPSVLSELAPSPSDRRSLLATYFEPNTEEREQGIKIPTAAHRSIARLISKGYVQVVVTTNFDRLLEQALAEVGVEPMVISSPSAAAGAEPLVRGHPTLVKVHGDYMSSDLKNTVSELAGYDERIDRLLDEVMDKYGLVVCGWSATWDPALRDAILRSPGRRYSTYWCTISELRGCRVSFPSAITRRPDRSVGGAAVGCGRPIRTLR